MQIISPDEINYKTKNLGINKGNKINMVYSFSFSFVRIHIVVCCRNKIDQNSLKTT